MSADALICCRFGRLVVVERDFTKESIYYIVRCDCGEVKSVYKNSLIKGKTVSCGCFHREMFGKAQTTHGKSDHPLYKIWNNMMFRVTLPSYVKRGITVCEEWQDFDTFYEDCSPLYVDGYSLDMVDPYGGYSLSNCRFIPRREQSYNLSMKDTNTSGVTGVSYNKQNKGWSAYYVDSLLGKRIIKVWPISKYGDNSFALACMWREEMLLMEIQRGSPYTIHHGQNNKAVVQIN